MSNSTIRFLTCREPRRRKIVHWLEDNLGNRILGA
jgi:hypothetical protein